MYRLCKHCGKGFETDVWEKVYCKRQCNDNARKSRSRRNKGSKRWKRTAIAKKEKILRNKDYVYEDKVSKGCSHCLERRPSCLDYHHVDPSTKQDDVSRLMRLGINFDKLKSEMAKCILLCANCHRVEELGDGFKNDPAEATPTPVVTFCYHSLVPANPD